MSRHALVLAVVLAGAATLGQTEANAAVELDLLLLVDVSGSVDGTEYTLQKTGYVNAFNNAAIHAAIASKPGGIAVAYAEWSGAGQQSLEVGWTHLTDATSSMAFATAIAAATRNFAGLTAIGSALDWGSNLGGSSLGDASTRWVIDVSGDGATNDGIASTAGRANALADGVDTINGLVILGEGGLQAHYQNDVIGGTNPLLFVANDFADFEAAVLEKIGIEIIGGPEVPEPASLIVWSLLVCATIGCGASQRQRG
jgi:hypothetical protein